jgi:hypothetical protein
MTKILLPFMVLFVVGCANVSNTRLIMKSQDATLAVEFPKELDAKNIKVHYDPKQGTFEITSDAWSSRNQGSITAQGSREAQILESSSVLVEKVTESAVRAAVKSAIPTP